MTSSPFRIPDYGTHVVNVSGGRTSAFLLYKVLEEHRGTLPSNCRAIFTNTGKEFNETLDFLKEIEQRWNVPIIWLEYFHRAHLPGREAGQRAWYRRVNYYTASREGQPFDRLLAVKRMVPNMKIRSCTEELKINTARRFVRHELGDHHHWSYLGIRLEETPRWTKALFKYCRSRYPLVDAKLTIDDVDKFWKEQPFRLNLRAHQSNCDLCFLKSPRKLKSIMSDEPQRVRWWSEREEMYNSTFLKRQTYLELFEQAALVDEELLDDTSVSCFCGD